MPLEIEKLIDISDLVYTFCEVMDHIDVFVSGNERVSGVMMANAEEIKENVLADAITVAQAEGFTKDWDINGEKVVFTVVKK